MLDKRYNTQNKRTQPTKEVKPLQQKMDIAFRLIDAHLDSWWCQGQHAHLQIFVFNSPLADFDGKTRNRSVHLPEMMLSHVSPPWLKARRLVFLRIHMYPIHAFWDAPRTYVLSFCLGFKLGTLH